MTNPDPIRIYAHQLVEFPSEVNGNDLVRQIARYYIARAFGFWQAAEDLTNPNHVAATERFLLEYELALVWQSLASGIPSKPWAIASYVKALISHPEDTAKVLYWLLEWAELDPARILPYMSKTERTMPDPTLQRPEPDVLSVINYPVLIGVRTSALTVSVAAAKTGEEDAAVLMRANMFADWVLAPILADLT